MSQTQPFWLTEAFAQDLPGNSGGTGTTTDPGDPSDITAAQGGSGNGYGGGGAGGGIGAANTLGGSASIDGNGGDGAFSFIHGVTTPGGAGGSVGQTTLGADVVHVTGGSGQSGVNKHGSGGGGGGAGLFLSDGSSFSLAANSTVTGGIGGAGGVGAYQSANGAGGGGGAGILLRQSNLTVSNGAAVVGGKGGNAGGGGGTFKSGGGAGGDGIVIQGGALVNQGSINGGNGGTDSSAYSDNNPGARGGDGGSGVFVDEGTLHNQGDIAGGKGGGAYQKGRPGTSGSGLRVGSDSRVINDGTIEAGGADANAVDILGNNNTFEIASGSVITGNVVVKDGAAGNVFAIGGSGDSSFDVSLIGSQYQGFQSYRKDGSSTWTLTGTGAYSGGFDIAEGIVRAGNDGTIFGTGLLTIEEGARVDLDNYSVGIGGLAGEGNVALGSGNLTVDQGFDTLFSGVIDGSGALTKSGTGTLTLTGANSYTGQTIVSGGTLKQGAAGAFNTASSGYDVAANSTLDLGGFSTSLAALANNGQVSFGGSGGVTLKVAGNYVGNGGMMTINTVLGGDDSKTDMLKVGGDTSGSTKLYVNNAGGVGAQTVNGIKVIDVAGSSEGSFSLANSYTTKDGQQAVVGGAYAYTLQQGGTNTPTDGDWYLVSHVDGPNPGPEPEPRYSAGVPVYEGYVQNMLALNMLPTLQQRVGTRYWTGKNGNGADNGAAVNEYGVWARVEGAHNRFEPDTSTSRMKQDINTLIMQAGVDGQFYEGENGKLIAGITGQYGHAKGDVSSFHGDGDISTDAWSLGATATWYGNNGFYVDGQGQVTWFDNDLNSWTANTGLADSRKATGYALSIEAGQRIGMQGNWALTPQVQLMWSSIDADAFNDTWGSRVSLHGGDSLVGRLGLAADYRTSWKGDDGLLVNTSMYGIANLYQEFLGGTTVNVSGVDFDTDNDRIWAGIGAGGTYAWDDDKYAVYGEGSINTALNHFADSYTLKGIVGFKAKW
ncbi:autotransporter family protein [Brucella sp. LJL56]